ncbi:MAG TPA: argininosuccinate lyase [Xanthobacteraceae bacterium]|nr:argininosuccinate lyase [Xanthobacteraceae bacterium]
MSTQAEAQRRDPFYWLSEMNKASAIMVVEQGIVPNAFGTKIAQAVTTVIADGNKPGAVRSGNYLIVERDLIKAGGPDITRIHSGRSRQDIGATSQRLAMRDDLLAAYAKLNAARGVLLAMAERHPNAILPAYTWGVQAQPITFGHYVLAYSAAFARTAERMQQVYARLNLSPLGAAALGTSSFPVNRPRLAELLGFDGVVENSFDANQISPIDTGAEAMSVVSTSALTISALVADITQQYAQAQPWLLLAEGEMTGTSSIMPQKRNPSGLVFLRAQASTVLGHAQTFLIVAHNVSAGMSDYKPFINPLQGDQPNNVMRELTDLYDNFGKLMKTLVFNEARALAEVDADYSTTTELADTLQRVADVPFRVGHHFASEIVNYGRGNNLKPAQIPYVEAQHIYAEAAKEFKLADTKLPLTEAQFRTSLTAQNMVAASQGLGGPQPAEVARMLAAEQKSLKEDGAWLDATQAKLAAAQKKLDETFAQLSTR